MYAERFDARRGFRPGPMGVAVAINGAVIAALIFANPDMIRIKPAGSITVIKLADPLPPPPEHQRQKPKPDTHVTTVEHVVKTPIQDDVKFPPFETVKFDPGPSLGGGGDGAGTVLDPPVAPKLISATPVPGVDFQPLYPPAMRRAEMEGRVTVKILIGVDGRVKQLELVSSPSQDFTEATRRQALGRWRFKPATRGGIPVESWQTMSVRFVLND